ncbi:unnamed protein product [Caenorhabditis auriculariae]|uniref:Uncharacterized protein n=1 Tax=Caenorhabditis auriculariae TaxID=2777116 RepID=A0A8S1GXU8_9PELO|nr:unnamed protein product [Caenorhabditis auriculariae]
MLAKNAAKKNGLDVDSVATRAPLKPCIDPEFEHLAPFMRSAEPETKSSSIYDEVDPRTILDFYGDELPTKVEAWNVGPATFTPRFNSTEMRTRVQSSE